MERVDMKRRTVQGDPVLVWPFPRAPMSLLHWEHSKFRVKWGPCWYVSAIRRYDGLTYG